MTELTFIPLDEAVELADCPGLTADLIRQLAKRDKVMVWADIPGQGFAVEQHGLLNITRALNQARAAGQGQYINGHDAELRYGIHRSSWGRWRDRGIVRQKDDLLYLEDIMFIAKLVEFVKPKTGRPLFPHSYDPYCVVSLLTKQHA